MSYINENCFVWNWCWQIAATKILNVARRPCKVPIMLSNMMVLHTIALSWCLASLSSTIINSWSEISIICINSQNDLQRLFCILCIAHRHRSSKDWWKDSMLWRWSYSSYLYNEYSAKNALKIQRFWQWFIESAILNLFQNVVTDIVKAIDKDLVINVLCITWLSGKVIKFYEIAERDEVVHY